VEKNNPNISKPISLMKMAKTKQEIYIHSLGTNAISNIQTALVHSTLSPYPSY
jgi:hypothetical protein